MKMTEGRERKEGKENWRKLSERTAEEVKDCN